MTGKDPSNITEAFFGQLYNFSKSIAALEGRITGLSDEINRISAGLGMAGPRSSAGSSQAGAASAAGSSSAGTVPAAPKFAPPRVNAAARTAPKIIAFPGNPHRNTAHNSSNTGAKNALTPFLAIPGRSLPSAMPDFRAALQRDGLILLAWDKRVTECGERYTAYWVTSVGTPRFYASKPFPPEEFPSACPDHKSYAAEDGIEFYGQEAPEYIVHVAPDLMMSNPRHRELRSVHIDTLKRYGSAADFSREYLLTKEKNRKLPHDKTRGDDDNQRVG